MSDEPNNKSQKSTPTNSAIASHEASLIVQTQILGVFLHDIGHQTDHLSMIIDQLNREIAAQIGALPRSELSNHIEAARASCNHILQLVRNMRDAVRPRSRIETFRLGDSVRDAFSTMESTLERLQIDCKLAIDESITLRGDQNALKQVFLNLIINSIEAVNSTPRRKYNAIHVEAKRLSRTSIAKCEFWDEGPGISPSAFPNVADIFHSKDISHSAKVGIGLRIVSLILRNEFGADISLVSREGAHFEISFPCHETKKTKE